MVGRRAPWISYFVGPPLGSHVLPQAKPTRVSGLCPVKLCEAKRDNLVGNEKDVGGERLVLVVVDAVPRLGLAAVKVCFIYMCTYTYIYIYVYM